MMERMGSKNFSLLEKMNAISSNIANADSTDKGKIGKQGNFIPYARQVPPFARVLSEKFRSNQVNEDVLNGVEVKETVSLKGGVKKVYDPSHPAARKTGTADAGYVYYPNIDTSQGLADVRITAASCGANLSALSASKRRDGTGVKHW